MMAPSHREAEIVGCHHRVKGAQQRTSVFSAGVAEHISLVLPANAPQPFLLRDGGFRILLPVHWTRRSNFCPRISRKLSTEVVKFRAT